MDRLRAVCRKAWECEQVVSTRNPGADVDRCLGELFLLSRESREAGDIDDPPREELWQASESAIR